MRPVALVVVASAGVFAQGPAASTDLKFDVVSIRRNTSNTLGSNGSSERPDGSFTLINVPMMTLVARAQFPAIPPVDMVGLPEWAQRERYDVSTTSPLGRPATPQERAAMIRAMLADRVRLETHTETRETPVYDLVLARADGRLGAGIMPSEVDCVAKAAADRAAADAGATPLPRPLLPDFNAPPPPCSGVRINDGMEGDVTMESLAFLLRATAGRPVVDKTGLQGSYRIKIRFDRALGGGPEVAAGSGNLPSVFSALPAELGLRLVSSTGARDVLVIDRLERPSDN